MAVKKRVISRTPVLFPLLSTRGNSICKASMKLSMTTDKASDDWNFISWTLSLLNPPMLNYKSYASWVVGIGAKEKRRLLPTNFEQEWRNRWGWNSQLSAQLVQHKSVSHQLKDNCSMFLWSLSIKEGKEEKGWIFQCLHWTQLFTGYHCCRFSHIFHCPLYETQMAIWIFFTKFQFSEIELIVFVSRNFLKERHSLFHYWKS